jgi:hypothetical protein
MPKKLIPGALAVLVLMFLSTLTLAQGTTSRVTGLVTDNTGATVAGATVTLTNEGTNTSVTTQTGDNGVYVFDLIQPGTYTVTVEKQGFKKFISNKNAALINQPTTVNAALQIGDVSAAVTVTGSAEQVQTSTSGNIGGTVEQRTLESLPIVGLRGRNPLDLLNFEPGVVVGSNTGGGVSVNGSRDRSFNFTLDGIDINESTAGGSNFTPLRPNPDSVQEFQIVTSNFSAELGRSSGASVTFVTRSGTNQFHGNLFDYYQTPRFNAKSYPITIAKLPKDQFVQHIFGGSIGGPLWDPGFGEGRSAHFLRDKAFFFVNLQLLRAYDTALVTRTVYTQSARTGLFRYEVGQANAPAGNSAASVTTTGAAIRPACSATVTTGCIATYNIATAQSVATIDPVLQNYINAMPLPNNFTTGDGLNTAGFNWASPQHERQYDFASKFDFNVNAKNSAYVRYAQGSQSSLGDSANGGRPIFPNSPNFVDTARLPKNLALNWRWSPTATIANELLYGWSKYFFSFATPHPDPLLPFTFLNPSTPNTNFSYNARGVRTHQFIDNLTIIRGSHTLKTGINFRYNQHTDDRSNVAGQAIEPTVTFSAPSALDAGFNFSTAAAGIASTDLTRLRNTTADLLGRVGTVSQAFVADPTNGSGFLPRGSRWINKANYDEYDFYGQDNWRVRSNFVLDLGLRWEVRATPEQVNRPLLVPNQAVKIGAAPSNNVKWVEGKLFKTAYNNIEPSVGFAWDPFKSGKTSIRGNYRLASDRFATFLFGSSIFQSTPGNALPSSNANFGAAGGLYRNVAATIAALQPAITPDTARTPPSFSTNSISVMDPDLRYPQIHEFSLSFQREIGKGNVVEATYIRKHAVHLLGGYNVNQANIFAKAPGISESFLDAFNSIRGSTAYNSPLINLIMTGNAANNGGTTRFRAINSTQLAPCSSTGSAGCGAVGTAAVNISQRTCQSADVSAGVCTNAQLNQRLLDLTGFSSFLQPYSQFTGGLNVFDSSDYSNYQGVELILRRKMTAGLSYQLAYTWSTSKDNRSWDPSLSTINTGNSQAGSATPFDLRDRSLNYAYSDFDRRHVFQATYVYELPFGAGKWLKSDNKIVNYIVGGWQLSGTTLWESGRPFTVYSGSNTLSSVIQSPANCNGCTSNMGRLILENGVNYYFTAAQRAMFSVPDPGTLGNLPRNFFRNAPYFQTDASVLRKFKFSERWAFDLRVDAKNLTNTPDFDISALNNNMTLFVSSSPSFGRVLDGTANSARRIQISGKLSF